MKKGQQSIITLILLFIMLVSYTVILSPLHAVIDDAISVNSYTGVIRVFLQFMPLIILLLMLAGMSMLVRGIFAGGL